MIHHILRDVWSDMPQAHRRVVIVCDWVIVALVAYVVIDLIIILKRTS